MLTSRPLFSFLPRTYTSAPSRPSCPLFTTACLDSMQRLESNLKSCAVSLRKLMSCTETPLLHSNRRQRNSYQLPQIKCSSTEGKLHPLRVQFAPMLVQESMLLRTEDIAMQFRKLLLRHG